MNKMLRYGQQMFIWIIVNNHNLKQSRLFQFLLFRSLHLLQPCTANEERKLNYNYEHTKKTVSHKTMLKIVSDATSPSFWATHLVAANSYSASWWVSLDLVIMAISKLLHGTYFSNAKLNELTSSKHRPAVLNENISHQISSSKIYKEKLKRL